MIFNLIALLVMLWAIIYLVLQLEGIIKIIVALTGIPTILIAIIKWIADASNIKTNKQRNNIEND